MFSNLAKDLDLLFDAPPMTHPHVADVYGKVARKLATCKERNSLAWFTVH
jgi:hypothetical protein